MKDQLSKNTQFGAHRGLRLSYPDNTLQGIVAAAAVADFVELDVRRSADGRMVLSHEPSFGSVGITDRTWEELRKIDLGDGYHPTLLDDVLEALPDTPLDIEIKNFPYQPGFDSEGSFAVEVAARSRPIDVVTCFFWPTMDVVKAALPDVRTGLLVFEAGSASDVIAAAGAGGHQLVAPHFSLLVESGEQSIDLAHETGLEVITWTVNDVAMAQRFVAAGIDGIISDDPAAISRSKDEH